MSDFCSYLSWGCLIFTIEMFFVIAPITSSFVHMALVMLMAVGGIAWFLLRMKRKLDGTIHFWDVFLLFHIFVSIRALMTGSARSLTDLFFYWTGMMVMFGAGSFSLDSEKSEKYLFDLLTVFGLFFAAGVFLQMMFTDAFLKYYFTLLDTEYRSSLRRQVYFHQMYTGWTTQTFATCINLMLGLYGAISAWERKKDVKYLVAVLVMLVAFLLTGKRGPLVFLLLSYIGTGIILSDSFLKMLQKVWKYAVGVVIAGCGLIVYVQRQGSTSRNTIVRFMEVANDTGVNKDDVSNGRFELWGLAVKLFQSHPLFGVGWRKYHEYALSRLNEDIEAHNVYLQLLAESGIVGLLLYLTAIIGGMIFTYRLLRTMKMKTDRHLYRLVKFSLMVQIYLFFYAFTGNTLYDYCAQMCYYLSFSLCLYAKNRTNLTWKEILQWIKL